MKKGQTGEGVIEKIEFPNKGVLHTEDGDKIIVKNCIPGQRIQFFVNKKRKGKCEGRLLQILDKSPLELSEAACVHFGSCGGCVYQNLPYEEQLAVKAGQVIELLKPAVKEDGIELLKPAVIEEENAESKNDEGFPAWFEGIKPSPKQFEYRNKMEFSFGDEYKDGPLALGMHKRDSFYDLVTVNQCRIVDSDFNQILQEVLDYFTRKGVSYLKKKSHEGYLRHLLVRKAEKTGEILIDLVTTTQYCGTVSESELMEGFQKAVLQLDLRGKIVGILHTQNDSVADVVKDEGTQILFGQDYFYEELLGLRFKISAFSFFQTNSLGAEVLYETVREFIGSLNGRRDSVVYDLYSGTGTIAQMMAPAAGRVIGVEIVDEAVQAARENAEMNGLSNCEFIAGDVLKVLDTIEEKPDFIILDPPREGVHPKALEKILDYGVERMVYISCKPTSLARDLGVMQERGYRVERCCCVDLFAGVYHVETVVLLSNRKSKPDTHVKLSLSMDDYYRIKEEGKNNQ